MLMISRGYIVTKDGTFSDGMQFDVDDDEALRLLDLGVAEKAIEKEELEQPPEPEQPEEQEAPKTPKRKR
jgi:hypothetical protein